VSDEEIRDPTGLVVVLTERRWTEHIIVRHPEMATVRAGVIDTVARPESIHLGRRDPTRRIYVRDWGPVPGVGASLTPLVLVGETGEVGTAYFIAEAFRKLGRQIWPSN